MAFPAASAALLDGLAAVAGLSRRRLAPRTRPPTRRWRQVDELIAKSTEHTAMVRQLEHSVDAAEGNPLDVGELPTGDEMAAELERYLARRGTDGSGPEDAEAPRERSTGASRCSSTADSASIRPRPRLGRAEDDGYDGLWSAETAHDPFFPLLLAAEHTERIQLGTGIAVAFARNPMTTGRHGQRPADPLRGPVHARSRLADQAAHHQALLDAVVAPGAPHARVHPGHAGHLVRLARPGTKLAFRGDFYTHTLMTPFFNPGPSPYGHAAGLPGRRRANS